MNVELIDPAATRPLRRQILRPHESLEALADHEPPGAVAAGISDGEELVAVGLIGPDGKPGGWRIRGMATAPSHRGRGLGGAVLSALMHYAWSAGAARIWCNARVPAVSLYERGGMTVVSDVFEIEPIGPHVVMEWRDGPGRTAGSPTDASPTTASARLRAARRPG